MQNAPFIWYKGCDGRVAVDQTSPTNIILSFGHLEERPGRERIHQIPMDAALNLEIGEPGFGWIK